MQPEFWGLETKSNFFYWKNEKMLSRLAQLKRIKDEESKGKTLTAEQFL